MKTILLLGGAFNVLCALFHLGFWKIFHWKADLAPLHPLNRGIMQTLNIVLIYVIIGAAALSFHLAGSAGALATTERWLLAFIGGIYLVRGAVQFPLFGAKRLRLGFGIMAVCLLVGGGYVAAAL